MNAASTATLDRRPNQCVVLGNVSGGRPTARLTLHRSSLVLEKVVVNKESPEDKRSTDPTSKLNALAGTYGQKIKSAVSLDSADLKSLLYEGKKVGGDHSGGDDDGLHSSSFSSSSSSSSDDGTTTVQATDATTEPGLGYDELSLPERTEMAVVPYRPKLEVVPTYPPQNHERAMCVEPVSGGMTWILYGAPEGEHFYHPLNLHLPAAFGGCGLDEYVQMMALEDVTRTPIGYDLANGSKMMMANFCPAQETLTTPFYLDYDHYDNEGIHSNPLLQLEGAPEIIDIDRPSSLLGPHPSPNIYYPNQAYDLNCASGGTMISTVFFPNHPYHQAITTYCPHRTLSYTQPMPCSTNNHGNAPLYRGSDILPYPMMTPFPTLLPSKGLLEDPLDYVYNSNYNNNNKAFNGITAFVSLNLTTTIGTQRSAAAAIQAFSLLNNSLKHEKPIHAMLGLSPFPPLPFPIPLGSMRDCCQTVAYGSDECSSGITLPKLHFKTRKKEVPSVVEIGLNADAPQTTAYPFPNSTTPTLVTPCNLCDDEYVICCDRDHNDEEAQVGNLILPPQQDNTSHHNQPQSLVIFPPQLQPLPPLVSSALATINGLTPTPKNNFNPSTTTFLTTADCPECIHGIGRIPIASSMQHHPMIMVQGNGLNDRSTHVTDNTVLLFCYNPNPPPTSSSSSAMAMMYPPQPLPPASYLLNSPYPYYQQNHQQQQHPLIWNPQPILPPPHMIDVTTVGLDHGGTELELVSNLDEGEEEQERDNDDDDFVQHHGISKSDLEFGNCCTNSYEQSDYPFNDTNIHLLQQQQSQPLSLPPNMDYVAPLFNLPNNPYPSFRPLMAYNQCSLGQPLNFPVYPCYPHPYVGLMPSSPPPPPFVSPFPGSPHLGSPTSPFDQRCNEYYLGSPPPPYMVESIAMMNNNNTRENSNHTGYYPNNAQGPGNRNHNFNNYGGGYRSYNSNTNPSSSNNNNNKGSGSGGSNKNEGSRGPGSGSHQSCSSSSKRNNGSGRTNFRNGSDGSGSDDEDERNGRRRSAYENGRRDRHDRRDDYGDNGMGDNNRHRNNNNRIPESPDYGLGSDAESSINHPENEEASVLMVILSSISNIVVYDITERSARVKWKPLPVSDPTNPLTTATATTGPPETEDRTETDAGDQSTTPVPLTSPTTQPLLLPTEPAYQVYLFTTQLGSKGSTTTTTNTNTNLRPPPPPPSFTDSLQQKLAAGTGSSKSRCGVGRVRSDRSILTTLPSNGMCVYSGPLTECSIQQLNPFKEYEICVAATLDNQRGRLSKPVLFKTLSTIPDVPLPPLLTQKTKCSLTLKWMNPADNGSKVLTYTLQYADASIPQNSPDFVEAYTGSARQYKTCRLKPATTYTFRLSATNARGTSDFSDRSTFCTSGMVPSAPAPPSLVRKSHESFTLTWDRLNAGPDIGCCFTLQMEDPGTGHGFVTVFDTTNTTTNVTSNGLLNGSSLSSSSLSNGCDDTEIVTYTTPPGLLHRNTSYNFRLRTTNEEGYSPWSEVVTFATTPASPSLPRKLGIKGKAQPTYLKIAWGIPVDDGGSPVQEYVLQMKSRDQPNYETMYGGPERETACHNLIPGSFYIFRVSCSTQVGARSAWSDDVMICTPATLPGCCEPPAIVSSNAHPQKLKGSSCSNPCTTLYSLALKWGPPEMDGGSPISEYELEMVPCQHSPTNSLPPLSPDATTPPHIYRGPSNEFFINDLLPTTTYQFKIRCANVIGWSTWSPPLTHTTGAGAPCAPSEPTFTIKSPFSVILNFASPAQINGSDIKEYILEAKSQQAKLPDQGSTQSTIGTDFTKVYNGPDTCHECKCLDPCQTYEFRLSSINEIGQGPFSPVVVITMPAAVPTAVQSSTVVMEKIEDRSVRVRWTAPDPRGSEITKYTLDVLQLSSIVKMSKPPLSIHPSPCHLSHTLETLDGVCSHTIPDLLPLQCYKLRIQAINGIGVGPFSAPIKFTTLPRVPTRAPVFKGTMSVTDSTNSNQQSIGPTFIKLRWDYNNANSCSSIMEEPDDNGSPPSCITYELEMADYRKSFTLVYTGDNTSFKTTKLTENSIYYYRIRAMNETGFGPYSPILTLRTIWAPPCSIKHVKVVRCKPDSCHISWSYPLHNHQHLYLQDPNLKPSLPNICHVVGAYDEVPQNESLDITITPIANLGADDKDQSTKLTGANENVDADQIPVEIGKDAGGLVEQPKKLQQPLPMSHTIMLCSNNRGDRNGNQDEGDDQRVESIKPSLASWNVIFNVYLTTLTNSNTHNTAKEESGDTDSLASYKLIYTGPETEFTFKDLTPSTDYKFKIQPIRYFSRATIMEYDNCSSSSVSSSPASNQIEGSIVGPHLFKTSTLNTTISHKAKAAHQHHLNSNHVDTMATNLEGSPTNGSQFKAMLSTLFNRRPFVRTRPTTVECKADNVGKYHSQVRSRSSHPPPTKGSANKGTTHHKNSTSPCPSGNTNHTLTIAPRGTNGKGPLSSSKHHSKIAAFSVVKPSTPLTNTNQRFSSLAIEQRWALVILGLFVVLAIASTFVVAYIGQFL